MIKFPGRDKPRIIVWCGVLHKDSKSFSTVGRKVISQRAYLRRALHTSDDFNDFNSDAVKFGIGSEKSVDPNRLRDFIFCMFDMFKIRKGQK
jgi:hypothetical protein